MKKKITGMRIIACMLAMIFIIVNCCPAEAFAAKSGDNGDKQIKEERVKKKKSNPRTDIIVKYKNVAARDNTVKYAKTKSGAGKFDQKNFFQKQKIGVYEVGAADDLEAIIDELNDDPNVEYAQPNYPLTIESIPTDHMLNYEWAIHNDGQVIDGNAGRATVDINAINAWYHTMGSSDVIVGILDTGIDIGHDDLKDNIYTNQGEIPKNGIDDDGNGYIDDINGWDFSNDDASVYDGTGTDTHGTYIAGIIAAGADNGGVVGVAPGVRVMPLKFIHGTTGYTSDAIEAIEYAMNMGVGIINCSFGGTDNNPALMEAMQSSGILFSCAAGNGGVDTAERNIYPAGFTIDNVISVAALDSKGVMPAFSNYGANVDIAAPATSVLSTTPDNGYDYYSGTSVAAAIVSGVAALVQSSLPDADISNIKNRILTYATPCASLTGKVVSGGRVDALGALIGTAQAFDDYNGEGNDSDVLPADGEGEADTWYIMDERASNVERFHYGEGGVNPASGNYSVTCIDMSIAAPGFTVNISRTYNSRNQRQTLLGRGWTFGFEGVVINKGDFFEVTLPNGAAHVFHLKNGIYIGEGTRAKFVKNSDGSYTLTTQDQYSYGFDAVTNKMTYMEDKNSNRILLTYSSGKLTGITDTAGRAYTLAHNPKGLLAGVTDPAGRTVTYEYNTDNLLIKVTDPQGGSLAYSYDNSGYLTTLTDQNGHIFQQLTYSHDFGDAQNKVSQTTDAAGETWYYSYDMNNYNATITNNENKKWTYWFDAAMFTVRVQDPEGKSSYTEYTFQDSNTYYGDVQAAIDRNGNRTDYQVDLATGNVTKITNPDGGIKTYVYDQWNNIIEEVNERGSRTFYFYDAQGANLLKKVRPANGTSNYTEGNPADFVITTYAYYTKSEAHAQFGCNAAGLLKSVTDPEGNTTTYTYDSYGNMASSTDAAGNTTTYVYDILGQKLSETTPEGNKTSYTYDKNGQIVKITNPDGGVKRTVYDAAGYMLLETEPNQYNAAEDNASTGIYSGTDGTKYEWYDNGCQKAVTDAEGNRTVYTWDIFGNKQTETKPNGAVYRYEYDSLNRLTKTYFREWAEAAEVLLSEISYGILPDGNTQLTTIVYADDTHKSTTVTVRDYAEREVLTQYSDYSRTSTTFNTDGTVSQSTAANGAATYYTYDALGNMTGRWSPVSVIEGTTMYSWTGYTYDKSGNLTVEKTGRSLVILDSTAADVYTKYYTYVNGLMTEQSDSEGRKSVYTYNGEQRVEQTVRYASSTNTLIKNYTYNYRGQLLTDTTRVRAGDVYVNIYASNYEDNSVKDVITAFSYDFNGNLISATDAAGNDTVYTYDKLNRNLTIHRQLIYYDIVLGDVTTSRNYTWDGKISEETDANGNTTRYSYDARGNQIKIIDALGKVTRKYYDRLCNNTAVVSPKNYQEGKALADLEHTRYSYDSLGRVIAQTEVYRRMDLNNHYAWTGEWVNIASKTYEYDPLGNVISVTDALGNTTESDYNLAGMPEAVIDAETREGGLPYTVRYSYNGLGQKTKEAYPGAVYEYTYDGAGNLLSTFINGILKSTSSYDLLNREISRTDGRNNTTTLRWNAFGKVSQTVTPGDGTIPENKTINQYDIMGNLKYSAGSTGAPYYYEYDSFGRLFMKAYKAGGSGVIPFITLGYDLNGNVLSQTDAEYNATINTCDALNRIISTTNPLGQTTEYTYDDNGNLISQKDYLGNVTSKVYDGINRLIEVRDAYGSIVQQLTYNDADAQDGSYDALHNRTGYRYDRNLRQTGITDAEGYTSFVTYDSRGNISARTDGNGNITTYKYDGENRLIRVTDALGNNTYYAYDAAGNLTSQTDGSGNKTEYQYNAANLLAKKIDPEGSGTPGKTESYTYHANGLMASKTDRNGAVTTYSYDTVGRLLSEDAGGEIQSYTYNRNGNLLSMTDATGTTVRKYDRLRRNNSKTVPDIGKATYEYDLASEETGGYAERTTDPKGNTTLKSYDRAGRLSKVTVGEGTTVYEYYANGNRSKITYPDGTTETYSYDRNNRVTGLINAKADKTVISSYFYTYDGAGNQLTKTEAKGTTVYTYDSLNRLSSVTEPEGKVTFYTYDGAGNRRTEKVLFGLTEADTVYNYDNRNRLISTLSSGGAYTRYLYDNNGNLISKTSGVMEPVKTGTELTAEDLPNFGLIIKRGSETGTGTEDIMLYTYDNYNRLTGTKSKDTSSTYRYNAQGYRVEKTINGKMTKYLYEADKVVLETDGSNRQTAFQAYGSSLLYRTAAADGEAGPQSYYYLYNAHGDVTSLIDAEGNIAVTYDYDAFGNILKEEGVADNSIRYAGYQYDEESGLYYLNARYYDSVTARFLSEDTYRGQANDPLSLNLYTYCANNPIKYTDPTGHWEEGDENLYPAVQDEIRGLTKAYNAAKTKEEKARIHARAEALRANKNNYVNKKDDNTGSGDKGGSSSKPKVTPTPVPSKDKKDVKKDDKKDTDKVIDADTLIDDNVVYYSQTDSAWSKTMYSSVNDKKQTIGSSGCGPTSMAMVITSLTDYTVTPKDTASFSIKNGYRTKSTGTSWGFFAAIAEEYDLEVTRTDNFNDVKNALNDSDCMVIASMGDGHFTESGHFIVLAGINEVNGKDMFTILDPNDNNGNWGHDGKIIRTDNSGIVLADANMVNKEHQEYFIVKKNK